MPIGTVFVNPVTIRSHLDQVKLDLTSQVTLKQTLQKKYHDCGTKSRSFQIGNVVLVKNQTSGPKWLPGQIQEVRGPVTYIVLLQDGRVMKRHVDQIRSRTVNIDVPDDAVDDFYPLPSSSSSKSTDMPSVTPPL